MAFGLRSFHLKQETFTILAKIKTLLTNHSNWCIIWLGRWFQLITFLIIASIILAIVGVVVLFRVFSIGVFNKRKLSATQAKATVIGKRMQEVSRGSPMGGVYHNRYYATFDLGNDDTIEMAVNKSFSKKFDVGNTGTLFFKGDKYLSFE